MRDVIAGDARVIMFRRAAGSKLHRFHCRCLSLFSVNDRLAAGTIAATKRVVQERNGTKQTGRLPVFDHACHAWFSSRIVRGTPALGSHAVTGRWWCSLSWRRHRLPAAVAFGKKTIDAVGSFARWVAQCYIARRTAQTSSLSFCRVL